MMDEVVLTIAKDLRKLATSLEELVKEKPTPKVPTNKPEVTLEEVRAKLAALMQAGKQKEVKTLLQKHGGEKLSDIPKSNYPVLLKDAEGV